MYATRACVQGSVQNRGWVELTLRHIHALLVVCFCLRVGVCEGGEMGIAYVCCGGACACVRMPICIYLIRDVCVCARQMLG